MVLKRRSLLAGRYAGFSVFSNILQHCMTKPISVLLGRTIAILQISIKCLEQNLYCPVSLPLFQMIKFSFNILVCTQHRSLKSSNDFIKSHHIYRQKPVNCVGAPQHRVNQLMNEKHNDQPLLHLIKMKETLFWFFI